MKTVNYTITIPEPCHEDWNKMLPDAKGKFCNSCSKSVYDFTTKTDAEINSILQENEGKELCGHLFKTQLNRPLNISVPYHLLPKNLPLYKAFAIACFFVFGTMLFSCTNQDNKQIDKIEILDKENQFAGGVIVAPIDNMQEVIESNSIEINEMVAGGMSYYDTTMIVDSIPEVPVIDEYTTISCETYIDGMMIRTISTLDTIEQNDTLIEKPTTIEEVNTVEKESVFSVFPNPNNGIFNIQYELKTKANVIIEIYDIKGLRVKTLVNQLNQYEGQYTIPSDLSDLTSGTYICRIIMNDEVKSSKIIIAR